MLCIQMLEKYIIDRIDTHHKIVFLHDQSHKWIANINNTVFTIHALTDIDTADTLGIRIATGEDFGDYLFEDSLEEEECFILEENQVRSNMGIEEITDMFDSVVIRIMNYVVATSMVQEFPEPEALEETKKEPDNGN